LAIYQLCRTGSQNGVQDESFSQDVNDNQMLEVIEPSEIPNHLVVVHAEMATEDELEKLAAPEEIAQNNAVEQLPVSDEMPQAQQGGSEIEWTFKDGRWVPINNGKDGTCSAISPNKQDANRAGNRSNAANRRHRRCRKNTRWVI
jgi:hypothetical protein